ncbi:MAG: 6-hydroxymethylpterin diphosphokinase MptE-like protein [Thermoplasmatota archaeon]
MHYDQIMATFGWDPAEDRAAAETLRPMVQRNWPAFGWDFKNRTEATVIGCGPQLESLTAQDLPNAPIVAADGATEWLMEQGQLPRAVVTDLDGNPDALQWAAENGATMVVHAHGHNANKFPIIEDWPIVLGTYQGPQNDALQPLRQSTGFTDGDRAALLLAEHHVKRIHMVGFDFDAEPSRYSHSWSDTKPQKLAIARDIIASIRGPEFVWPSGHTQP